MLREAASHTMIFADENNTERARLQHAGEGAERSPMVSVCVASSQEKGMVACAPCS